MEEETGLVANELHLLAVIDPLPGATAAKTHLFLATDLRPGVVHRDDTEIGIAVHWMNLGDAVDAVRTGRIRASG